MFRHLLPSIGAATLVCIATPARAANILFVADSDGDTDIVTALTADGHTVTMVTADFSSGSNPTLRDPLDGYDAVFWSADGPGYGESHTDTAAFSNLTDYVMAGGRVFVTGYDSIASPTDSMLIAFLGGTGSYDDFSTPGTITSEESSLTVGVADIRGRTVGASGDFDCLNGLGSTTTLVVASGSYAGCAQWALRALGAGEVAYVSSTSSSTPWATTGSAYNAAARNFAASADFSMADEGAPEIDFDTPSGVDEGASFTVTVTVDDPEDDTFEYSWDLDDDGSFGELSDTPDYLVEAGTTDGPSALRLGVEAVDEHGNTAVRYRTVRIGNVAPTVTSSPPTVVSVGVDIRYQLEVEDPAGDMDPLTYTLVAGPSRMNVSDSGLVTWIPQEADVTIGEERVSIEILVDDGDEGTATHAWELAVSPNHQPGPPLPLYPVDGIGLLDRTPRLAAQNARDPDYDPLTYVFQIDTADSFDSPALRESEPIAQTPGFTGWQLDEPLEVDRMYHWRVKANDGMVDSEWMQAAFYVVRDPDAPLPDAGVAPDAGTAADGGVEPRRRDDGGCSVGASGARGGSAWAAGLLALALLALRRRRR